MAEVQPGGISSFSLQKSLKFLILIAKGYMEWTIHLKLYFKKFFYIAEHTVKFVWCVWEQYSLSHIDKPRFHQLH